MGMGTYQPNYRYRQESPSAYSGAIVDLMKLKQQQYGGAIDSLDRLGQANKRNEISALMGTDEYMNADPAKAQALIAAMSGGRDLGENFAKTIKMSDDNKGDIQSNEWDETAATTLFGRQMTKQAANNAASMARQIAGNNAAMSRARANNTANSLIYGNESSGAYTGEQYAKDNAEMAGLEQVFKDENQDPVAKAEARKRYDEIKFNQTRKVSAGKLTQRQREALSGDNWKGNTSSSGKKNNAPIATTTDAVKAYGSTGRVRKSSKKGEVQVKLDNGNWVETTPQLADQYMTNRI